MQQNISAEIRDKADVKRRLLRLILSWTLVIVWASLIFFMSAHTGSGLDRDFGIFSQLYLQLKGVLESIFWPGIDLLAPIAHFLEYLVFAVLLTNLLRNYLPLRRACLLAIVIASLYGITDEFHQYFVPERTSDPLDWLVDTVGASVGSTIAYLAFREGHRKTDAVRSVR